MELSVYGSVVVSLVVGLLIGFLLGRGLSKSTQKSKLSQKILPNELERWRLQSKYATLLMEKKPMLKAKEMLGLVKAQIQENESEIQEVDEKVNQAAEEVTMLRNKMKKLKSKAEKQLMMETQFSNWVAKCVGLRSEAEDNNDITISLGYQQRFLKFVAKGETKPTIVGLMDSQAIVSEMKQATKKNFGFMEKVLASMDDGNSEYYSDMFALEE
jgi:hypothetical protein